MPAYRNDDGSFTQQSDKPTTIPIATLRKYFAGPCGAGDGGPKVTSPSPHGAAPPRASRASAPSRENRVIDVTEHRTFSAVVQRAAAVGRGGARAAAVGLGVVVTGAGPACRRPAAAPAVTRAALDPALVAGRGASVGFVEQEAENAVDERHGHRPGPHRLHAARRGVGPHGGQADARAVRRVHAAEGGQRDHRALQHPRRARTAAASPRRWTSR